MGTLNTQGNYPAGTLATHQCNAMFGLVGGSERTCTATGTGMGQWSGSITCEGECTSHCACGKRNTYAVRTYIISNSENQLSLHTYNMSKFVLLYTYV